MVLIRRARKFFGELDQELGIYSDTRAAISYLGTHFTAAMIEQHFTRVTYHELSTLDKL